MKHVLRLAASILFCSAIVGCSGAEKAAADLFISDEDEAKLGAEIKTQLETDEGLRYFEDPTVEAYVQGLVDRILPYADADRPGVQWRVFVVDDEETVNAFATPGGYLYFMTGLLLASDNEAEVLGVGAHEAGHVVGRHSARQMVQTYGLSAVISIALGDDPGKLEEIASQIAATGALLAYSRAHETESDEYGARYTSSAGFAPQGLATFFEKLKAQEGEGGGGNFTWLSTHPDTGDRIEHINQFIRDENLGGDSLGDASALSDIQARIQSREGIVEAPGEDEEAPLPPPPEP